MKILTLFAFVFFASSIPTSSQESTDETVKELLESILIPKIEFRDTPPSDCLAFIQIRSAEIYQANGGDPKVLANLMSDDPPKFDTITTQQVSGSPISMLHKDISAWDALVAVTSAMNLAIGFDGAGKMYFHPAPAANKPE